MKLIFSYITVICFLSSCGGKRDEKNEFIRLEKELVKDCIQYDSAYYTNRYKGRIDFERQSDHTDSIMDISDAYDSIILYAEKSSYIAEMNFIKAKIKRRIKFNPYHWDWNEYDGDTTLQIKDSLDIEFIKSSERIHISQIFRYVATGFQYGCIMYYTPRKYRPFYVYKKQGNLIMGKFNIGEYIIIDHNPSEMSLSKNNFTIKPLTYETDSFMTTASYLPIDTGNYVLQISHLADDPITGEEKTLKRSKIIYVKQ